MSDDAGTPAGPPSRPEPDPVREQLLGQLAAKRRHLLDAVDGLDEETAQRVLLPSGWTLPELLSHVTHDDELFWVSGVLGGDPRAAELLAANQDGWRLGAGISAADAVAGYTAECGRSDAVLAGIDLAAPVAWWPDGLFGDWRPATGTEVLVHLLVETATHAGHADAVRELIDGRQHLVLD